MTPLVESEPPAARPPAHIATRFAVRGLRSAGFGVIIAVCLTLAFGYPFVSTVAHSVCIAIASWFTIDSGRLAAAMWVYRNAPAGSMEPTSRWPGWPWMLPISLVGSIIGFSVGASVGDWHGRAPANALRAAR